MNACALRATLAVATLALGGACARSAGAQPSDAAMPIPFGMRSFHDRSGGAGDIVIDWYSWNQSCNGKRPYVRDGGLAPNPGGVSLERDPAPAAPGAAKPSCPDPAGDYTVSADRNELRGNASDFVVTSFDFKSLGAAAAERYVPAVVPSDSGHAAWAEGRWNDRNAKGGTLTLARDGTFVRDCGGEIRGTWRTLTWTEYGDPASHLWTLLALVQRGGSSTCAALHSFALEYASPASTLGDSLYAYAKT